MTVQELYEYAKQCGVSDYEIRVQYRDDGGESARKNELVGIENSNEIPTRSQQEVI